ncbi:MAG: cobalamin-dependent protein [bacterium]|nr:cobalamin-dependent protein [bacterium]
MEINSVQLITTMATVGSGANDGVYPPGGLLTIAKAIQNNFSSIQISIHDEHYGKIQINPEADIVGIQVASTLCYSNALKIAKQAKQADKIVVLGGPHVTALYDNIMKHRPYIDFTIRGKGERAFVELLKAIKQDNPLKDVPSLSWRNGKKIIHNDYDNQLWQFDDYTPLPLDMLTAGVGSYWSAFRATAQQTIDASFLLFTHFGCLYRQKRIDAMKKLGKSMFVNDSKTSFCSFCSLDDNPVVREPTAIISELKYYLDYYSIPKGAKIHLKCYGDNIGPQADLLERLANAIEASQWWNDYDMLWTFYCQSSYLNERIAKLLKKVGATRVFIGFDGVNDSIQRINGLGTSKKTHLRAVGLCLKYGIQIQAASVVGLRGETPESLEELYQFFKELRQHEGLLERINSAIFFIIPNTPAYYLLIAKEPHIKNMDLLPTNEIRALWLKHFCPEVNIEMLEDYANKIDALSPGPHASMGFRSSWIEGQNNFIK